MLCRSPATRAVAQLALEMTTGLRCTVQDQAHGPVGNNAQLYWANRSPATTSREQAMSDAAGALRDGGAILTIIEDRPGGLAAFDARYAELIDVSDSQPPRNVATEFMLMAPNVGPISILHTLN